MDHKTGRHQPLHPVPLGRLGHNTFPPTPIAQADYKLTGLRMISPDVGDPVCRNVDFVGLVEAYWVQVGLAEAYWVEFYMDLMSFT